MNTSAASTETMTIAECQEKIQTTEFGFSCRISGRLLVIRLNGANSVSVNGELAGSRNSACGLVTRVAW